MDAYTQGKLVGYLRTIECPAWVKKICDDLDVEFGVAEYAQEETDGEAAEEVVEEAVEESGEETQETDPDDHEEKPEKSKSEQFVEMDDAGHNVNRMSAILQVSVPTINNWRAKHRKAEQSA